MEFKNISNIISMRLWISLEFSLRLIVTAFKSVIPIVIREARLK